jgi:SAM-dependent methyltransferase
MQPATDTLLQQLKTLADATRMRLLALCRHGDCSVSELTQVIGLSQPRTSQQLKQLCDAGLLQRFRDGQRMYYRVPSRMSEQGRALQGLIPHQDPVFAEDVGRLRRLRGDAVNVVPHPANDSPFNGDKVDDGGTDRAIHREIVALTVTAPLGDVLDVGCGRGKIIKLLASRAHRIVGVDIDADTRTLARAELMLAGVPNCSLRQGDMYRLPFDDAEFDTIILDDVVTDAKEPVRALLEAKRLLRTRGRLLILQSIIDQPVANIEKRIAEDCAAAGLRLAAARLAPKLQPAWLLSVATAAHNRMTAA